MARDYYEVLGVPRDADDEEIQRAFRRLARQNHPDINKDPAAEERFKEINEAYQVLSDPETRRRYDRFGPDFRRIPEDYDTAGAGASWAGFGRGGRWEGGFGRTSGFGPDVGISIEDLFDDLFVGRMRAGPLAGADQEAEIALTLEEAYRGGRHRITLPGPGGPRSYEVNIPRGVVDGQAIRLAGQGGQGLRGGPPGDLYLIVRIEPHPHFRLDGRDIITDLPVTPSEAALGATVPVRTPGGEVKVRVPPGTSSGRRLRLRGEGMPNPRGAPGDLYVVVSVAVPSRLGQRERKLYEELAAASSFDPRAAGGGRP